MRITNKRYVEEIGCRPYEEYCVEWRSWVTLAQRPDLEPFIAQFEALRERSGDSRSPLHHRREADDGQRGRKRAHSGCDGGDRHG